MHTVQEAANKYNKSTSTIYAWLKAGKLAGHKQSGRWLVAEKQELVENNQKESIVGMNQAIEALKEDIFTKIDQVADNMQKACCVAPTKQKEEASSKKVTNEIVENQRKLQEENEKLNRRNNDLLEVIRALTERVKEIEKRIAKSAIAQASQAASPAEGSGSDSNSCRKQVYNNLHNSQSKGKAVKSEANAERWARNNINLWFSQPCDIGQLAKHSWEEIALNRIGKVNIKGHMQKSRAFLHIAAKTNDSHWKRIKARIALELTEHSEGVGSGGISNHYLHPHETGG